MQEVSDLFLSGAM